jgi:hypothetical protein
MSQFHEEVAIYSLVDKMFLIIKLLKNFQNKLLEKLYKC